MEELATGDRLPLPEIATLGESIDLSLQMVLFCNRFVVGWPAIGPSINHMLFGNPHESFVSGLVAVDRRTKNLFVLVGSIRDGIPIRIADATVSDEPKTAFGAYTIDTHEIDIVLKSSCVRKILRKGIMPGGQFVGKTSRSAPSSARHREDSGKEPS